MERKQFAAHQEKVKQEKCKKLNKLEKVHGAKVVPMTEWEEEMAPLSEKAAKFGAKVQRWKKLEILEIYLYFF